MAQIRIQGVQIDVDIEEELAQYTWDRPRWTSEKLIAASPFRYDRTPSFFANLEGEYAGAWGDSGAYDADYESGNLPKLLAFLRDESYEETCEYLFEMYKPYFAEETSNVNIRQIRLRKGLQRIKLGEEVISPCNFRHIYLGKRGVSDRVQRFFGVGYRKDANAVTIPWRHADGSLANVKYRKVRGKAFWYERGGAPIRSLIYGIDKVYKHDLRTVYVCEAEIDAMSCYTAGVPAVALGGASVSERQLDLIRMSPIEHVIIAVDNDKPGRKLRKQLIDGLRKYVRVSEVEREDNAGKDDMNDLLVNGRQEDIKKTAPVMDAAFQIQLR